MSASSFNGPTVTVATVNDGAEGTFVASGATLQVQGNINVANEFLTLNGTGFNNAGALENVSGFTDTWASPVTLGSNSVISVDGVGDRLIISSPISDNGTAFGVTEIGPGTLDYQGANTYTGLTTVNQGTLLLDAAAGNSLNGNLVIGQG